ncbi:MAG: SCP2 sterol-binding domain-containing protein [Chloroflexi bacterium]|nr:SCP2 sterol-binding domain-containing protein [Chloroflexota bacterium]
MAIQFPSAEWVTALMEALNASEAYGHVAKNWEGDIIFVVLPEGELKEPAYLYLDLWHGKCRGVRRLDSPDEKKAAFTLTASLGNFIKILNRQLDPMQVMLTRRLQVQGNMVVMMRNVPTVLEFVRTATTIPSQFPAI